MRTNRSRRACGMSLIEVTIASFVISALLFAATVVANRSFAASQTINRVNDLERTAQGVADTIAAAMSDAGLSTISTIPGHTGGAALGVVNQTLGQIGNVAAGTGSTASRALQGTLLGGVSSVVKKTTSGTAALLGVGGGAPPTPTAESDRITFRPAAGFTGGTDTWKAEERIEWRANPKDPVNGADDDKNGIVDDGIIVWVRNVGTASVSTTVIGRDVPSLAPGEATNSLDDNQDGLADERGLSFALVKNGVRVRVTVARRTSDGDILIRSAERLVALRN